MAKNSELKPTSGHDAKGRLVILIPNKKGFTVSKPYTGYKENFLSKEKANNAFEFQLSCTANQ